MHQHRFIYCAGQLVGTPYINHLFLWRVKGLAELHYFALAECKLLVCLLVGKNDQLQLFLRINAQFHLKIINPALQLLQQKGGIDRIPGGSTYFYVII